MKKLDKLKEELQERKQDLAVMKSKEKEVLVELKPLNITTVKKAESELKKFLKKKEQVIKEREELHEEIEEKLDIYED